MEVIFNKPINGKKYSVLNTYGDILGLLEEQIIEIQDNINIKLVNEAESDTKLTANENKINVRFSDDNANSIDK